jgi:hypothetical protein
MRIPSFSILAAIACMGVLGGCTSSTDPGDREFFNRGWVNPRDLDTDDNFRPKERLNDGAPTSPTQLDDPLGR